MLCLLSNIGECTKLGAGATTPPEQALISSAQKQ